MIKPVLLWLVVFAVFLEEAKALTLTAGQTDYTTFSDITVSSGAGVSSNLSGTSLSLNKITNIFTITTSGSSVYGIKSTGNYNRITNAFAAFINTSGSSGRGISVADYSVVNNAGNISTLGTTSYGVYAGGDHNSITNSGAITTTNTTSYGIYLNGNNNSASNSGSIATKVYGIYASGNVNQINNAGTIITTVSSSAHGIFVSAGSASTASVSSYSTINNSGVINSSGNGIYAKDNYTVIQNSGTITANSASSIYGIRSEGDNSLIENLGEVTSVKYAVYSSGVNSVINNFSNLNGGVYFSQSNVLNILGGTIGGVLDSDGTGNINVGSSSYHDVIFNQTADFNHINDLAILYGSTLNSAASILANRILLDNNSVLNVNEGSSVNAVIRGSLDGVGVVNIFSPSFSDENAIGVSGGVLASLNVKEGAILNMANDIYANDVVVDGVLNFNGADNLQIIGDVTVRNAAVLSAGANNQVISGSFTLNDGAALSVTLKDGGVGNFDILGAANVSGAAKLKVSTSVGGGYISDGTSYVIVSSSAASAINKIAANNISVNGNNSNIYGLLKFTTDATANSLILHIDRLLPDEVTSNQNSQNIYQSLVNIGPSAEGKLSQFQQYLDNSGFTGDALTKALNQIEPQSTKAEIMSINNVISNSIEISEKRFEQSKLDGKLWVRFFGASIMQDAVKDDEGYRSNSSGIVFGLEKEIGDSSLVGSSISLARSNIKNWESSKTNVINTYQVNFFGRHNFNDIFVDSTMALALNQFGSSRLINAVNSSAKADYFGKSYALKIKSGFVDRVKYGLNISPEITFNFLHNDIAAYSEKGSDNLRLDVSGIKANLMEARGGLNLKYNFKKRHKKFEFQKFSAATKISYGRAFINNISNVRSSFVGYSQNSFINKVSHLDNDSARLGVELSAYHKDNTVFTLEYNFDYRATSAAHFAMAIIRSEF